jgi:hypothetical protein
MSLINSFRFRLRNINKLYSNTKLISRSLTSSKLKYINMNKQDIINGQETLINEYLQFINKYPYIVHDTIEQLEDGTKSVSYIQKLNDKDKIKFYSNIYMICHSVLESLNIIEQQEKNNNN